MWKYIVPMEWLQGQLGNNKVRIVDCRFILGKPNKGHEEYEEGHLPGAIYLDLEKDLSGPKLEHGGRHPLPDVQKLSETFSLAGIDETVSVIAYDDQGGAMASRLWWLLTYLGHDKAYVLNQGIGAWENAGLPMTREVPVIEPKTFVPRVQTHMLVCMEDVRERKEMPHVVLLDSRESNRYKGIEEPIDPVAGHIPGALNYFWKGSLDEKGAFKTQDELQMHFKEIPTDQEVIVYCGSGVTACPNILALKEAGYKNVLLYGGSFSDWCSYPENPIAVSKQD